MFFRLPDYWPRTYLLVGCTAFVLAALLMPLAIYVLKRFGVMDAVAENKIHTRPIPRGGGIVLFIAFAVAVLLPGYRSHGMNGILVGGFICMVVGAIDDYAGGIAGFWKLLTLFLVTLVLSYFEVRLNLFKIVWLDIAFTMLWIVGVTSAFNGTDNMDGLASGIAAIVSGMFFIIALQAYLYANTENNLSWFGMMAIALVGANLGFLIYNFKPALIFMGDSGSFFLGFTLAALGVMGEWTENRIIACTIPVLILGVPLFDFTYIIIARILRGETRTLRQVIDHCAPDHLSHRLVWFGFTQRQAVLFIYLICLALGVTGILLRNTTSLIDSQLALFQGLAIVSIVIILMVIAARRHEETLRTHLRDFARRDEERADAATATDEATETAAASARKAG
ncbi:MAG: undecaprenyl/decaprenyl-phosphate alpha-N-acetylglucosaminyl 1-phosphate transferase [Candidatus Hydrogenedentes bacterium]|nr:undecaprenyl/decaprenyl-phosphate alpha-N-acetylglucosaminyl 1-phosphate transferase [Candidatus Hydrogenedentota bacterium]